MSANRPRPTQTMMMVTETKALFPRYIHTRKQLTRIELNLADQDPSGREVDPEFHELGNLHVEVNGNIMGAVVQSIRRRFHFHRRQIVADAVHAGQHFGFRKYLRQTKIFVVFTNSRCWKRLFAFFY